MSMHRPDGSRSPAATLVQLPRATVSAHDWHAPEQLVLQQIPWAQTPLTLLGSRRTKRPPTSGLSCPCRDRGDRHDCRSNRRRSTVGRRRDVGEARQRIGLHTHGDRVAGRGRRGQAVVQVWPRRWSEGNLWQPPSRRTAVVRRRRGPGWTDTARIKGAGRDGRASPRRARQRAGAAGPGASALAADAVDAGVAQVLAVVEADVASCAETAVFR